jgi:hypothetical protein
VVVVVSKTREVISEWSSEALAVTAQAIRDAFNQEFDGLQMAYVTAETLADEALAALVGLTIAIEIEEMP